MAEQHYYPPPSFHFKVIFNIPGTGNVKGNEIFFRSVSGLDVELETEKVKIGGENRYEYELPKRAKYHDVTLKRGLLVKNSIIQKWILDTMNLRVIPANVQIMLLNEKHKGLMTWNLQHVWVKKWSFSDLDADKSEIMVETMILRYNSFTLAT